MAVPIAIRPADAESLVDVGAAGSPAQGRRLADQWQRSSSLHCERVPVTGARLVKGHHVRLR